MKVNDIIQEGVVSTLAKDLVGSTNWQAIQLRKQEKAQQQAQQQAAASPPVDPTKLQPLSRANPARTAPVPEPVEPEKVALTPGVAVVKAVDPVILSYNGKNFTRQANGAWTKLGQTKPVDPNTQQFLDSELAKL